MRSHLWHDQPPLIMCNKDSCHMFPQDPGPYCYVIIVTYNSPQALLDTTSQPMVTIDTTCALTDNKKNTNNY